jgi:Sec-independent protein secretion pathway component TatC
MFLALFMSAHFNKPVPYEYRRISLIIVIGVLIFFSAWNLAPERILLSILVKLSFILLFFIVLFVTNFFTFQEKQYISKKMNNVKLFILNENNRRG